MPACNCQNTFEIIEGEELNLIQHGRLTSEQITFLKTRVGSRVYEFYFVGKHMRYRWFSSKLRLYP